MVVQNLAIVYAITDSMVPVTPSHVVDEIMYRHVHTCRARLRIGLCSETQNRIFPNSDTTIAKSATHIAITEIIDQVIRDGPRIANCDAFRVVRLQRAPSSYGELKNVDGPIEGAQLAQNV